MINPFKADMILDKIKKYLMLKGISSTSYKYQSKDITEFEDKTVEVEISRGEYKSKIAFDLFENILLSTVFNFYKHIYDNKRGQRILFGVSMKKSDVVLKAIDEIVEAISNIHGCDSNGEPVVVESNGDEIISFEDGEIVVPTKYLNKNGVRLTIKLKVSTEYI